ncbi:hypothetical protein KAJ83_18240 [Marivibrio halodurans]|uniref:Uncharacterized protein n=1 Tax=Marivibrio halodurans TaxID=2039722 RepID=A0A8J7S2A0_9PROT|nr:hypothetical protein [Marivibrio halodurans]MBP5858965.1 hypothetical protein [Marivibrio halodurans]
MILEANNPAQAGLAAQTAALQRETQAQRASLAQPSAPERAETGPRSRPDRAEVTGPVQTRQAVEATETRDQRVASDRAATRPEQPEGAPPPRESGRGQLLDIYA